MDHVHKALIGPGFRLSSPLKRKPSSCGVCRLRFNSEVGGVLRELSLYVVFSLRVLLFLTHTLVWQLNSWGDLPMYLAVLLVLKELELSHSIIRWNVHSYLTFREPSLFIVLIIKLFISKNYNLLSCDTLSQILFIRKCRAGIMVRRNKWKTKNI